MGAAVRTIGEVTGRRGAADALAARVDAVLGHPRVRPDAPTVLLVIGDSEVRLSEIWFVRGASIHGAVLEAAGGRNAVAEPLHGPPRMSLADAIALDPDAVVVLVPTPPSEQAVERTRTQWAALDGMRAVQQGRVAVLAGPDVQSVGPDVLDLVPRLESELQRLFGAQ
jgi:iron complex transport system substrate-binding protein